MREQILQAIRGLAKANKGQSPGSRLFEQQTGIREAAWRGVYWARWGDAVKEAGLQPNSKRLKLDENFFLQQLAKACRHFGKLPTAMEFRMYGRENPDFPNHKTIYSHFQTTPKMFHRLALWTDANADYADVAILLSDHIVDKSEPDKKTRNAEGSVYLIRSGAHYKIGRSDELERRVKQIRVALPDKAVLIHSIRTDDAPGIENYWHRRFENRRANGEWFKLTMSDVSAFKRRKFQ